MEYEIILQAIPWRTNRSFLGLGNIVLVSDSGKNILIDTGHYGDRKFLLQALKTRGFMPDNIDIVILTHCHFDHVMNVDLFKKSQVLISKTEYDYAINLHNRDGIERKNNEDSLVSEDIFTPTYIKDILDKINLKIVCGDETVTKNVKLVKTPGHTPGHISVLLNDKGKRVMVASDAVHFFTELFSKKLILTYGSVEDGKRSIDFILKNSDIIIPGHDKPCVVKNGKVIYSDVREREWDIVITSYV